MSDSSQPGNSPNPEGKTCEISQSFMLVDTKVSIAWDQVWGISTMETCVEILTDWVTGRSPTQLRPRALGTGPVCPAPTRLSLVAERWLDVQSGPCNAATTARCCTLCAIRCTLYAVRCALYADRRCSRRTRLQEEENLEKRDMVNMFSRDLQAKPPQLAALAERCPTLRKAER